MKLLSQWLPARALRGGLLAMVAIAASFGSVSAHAAAGELTVMSIPSMKVPLAAVLDAFKKESGLKVATEIVSPRQLKAKLADSTEHPDIVLADEAAVADLNKSGKFETVAPVGRSGLGIAAQAGKPAPDIASPEALKQALLSSRAVLHADPGEGPWGRLAAALIEKLGITQDMKAKVRLGSGSNALAPVGFGDVPLGLHGMSEIVQTPSVALVGPVPASLQQWVRFDAALVKEAPNESDAKRLMQFLASPGARAVWNRHALEAPQP